jgi:hypothetical protein
MKKVILLVLGLFLGNLSFGQAFTGAPLGLLINNTSTCEVYVQLRGYISTGGSVCGDVNTNWLHLMPSPGPGNSYYAPSWDPANMFYSGGTIPAGATVTFERADFQFGNCACGSSGDNMGIGCGAGSPTWTNACINGIFQMPTPTPFSGPLLVRF